MLNVNLSLKNYRFEPALTIILLLSLYFINYIFDNNVIAPWKQEMVQEKVKLESKLTEIKIDFFKFYSEYFENMSCRIYNNSRDI